MKTMDCRVKPGNDLWWRLAANAGLPEKARSTRAKPNIGRAAMKKFASMLCLVSLLAPATALAQAFPPNAAGVTMGHWHLNSVSVEANQKLLVALGGVPLKPGDFNLVRFPGVFVFLHLRQTGTPPTGGTE